MAKLHDSYNLLNMYFINTYVFIENVESKYFVIDLLPKIREAGNYLE